MKKTKKERSHLRILSENPYDIETMLESMLIASNNNKEIIFIDNFVNQLRKKPESDITELSYNILKDLKLLELEKT